MGDKQFAKPIVVSGHICLDIIPRISSSNGNCGLTPGALVECGPALMATGGTVSNTGLALHRLGAPVRLVGKVGDDSFGKMILETLKRYGDNLTEHMLIEPGTVSSYTVVISPPGVDRTFFHCPGANNMFCANDVKNEVFQGAGIFHFGYPPLMQQMYANDGEQSEQLFCRAKENGLVTSLDMALPDPNSPAGKINWLKYLAKVLPYVDIFLPSLDETLFMLDHKQNNNPNASLLANVADQLLALGTKIVVLKLGDQGLYLRTTDRKDEWLDRELYIPCFKVNVAGTTGAGDCTIAGFLAAFANGLSPEETLRMAVAVGACNVEAADAWSGIRPWDEVMRRIQAGWKQLPSAIQIQGWEKDSWIWKGPNDRK
ncbi:MAG: carbohydrate kinase family protein [Pseudomonadota bacterium]